MSGAAGSVLVSTNERARVASALGSNLPVSDSDGMTMS